MGMYVCPTKKCKKPGCKKTYYTDKKSSMEAHREGWYTSRWKDEAWCPKHLPEWVVEWRNRKKAGGE